MLCYHLNRSLVKLSILFKFYTAERFTADYDYSSIY